jgi:TBC domain-containing protein kinase-like protein
MTLFSHLFSLDRIFLLYDTLLLREDTFYLFIGYSILKQLRDQLLSKDFSNCMLLFTDMPSIDIHTCIADAAIAAASATTTLMPKKK